MVSTLKVAVFASLILAALGCSEKKTTKEVQEEKILATPAEIVSRMHQMTNEIFVLKERQGFLDSKLIAKSVHAITNDSERLELLDQLADCVMSVDVSSFDYHKQFNSLFSIKSVMEDVVNAQPNSRTHRERMATDHCERRICKIAKSFADSRWNLLHGNTGETDVQRRRIEFLSETNPTRTTGLDTVGNGFGISRFDTMRLYDGNRRGESCIATHSGQRISSRKGRALIYIRQN